MEFGRVKKYSGSCCKVNVSMMHEIMAIVRGVEPLVVMEWSIPLSLK